MPFDSPLRVVSLRLGASKFVKIPTAMADYLSDGFLSFVFSLAGLGTSPPTEICWFSKDLARVCGSGIVWTLKLIRIWLTEHAIRRTSPLMFNFLPALQIWRAGSKATHGWVCYLHDFSVLIGSTCFCRATIPTSRMSLREGEKTTSARSLHCLL